MIYYLHSFIHVSLAPMPIEMDDKLKEGKSDEQQALKVSNGTAEIEPTPKQPIRSLKSCITSSYFLLDLVWFTFLGLQLYMFLGLMNPWLQGLAQGEKTIGMAGKSHPCGCSQDCQLST